METNEFLECNNKALLTSIAKVIRKEQSGIFLYRAFTKNVIKLILVGNNTQ